MKRSRALLLAASLSLPAVISTTASPPAYAQSAEDKNTARVLGIEGQEALDRKDFKTAEDRFARADALYHAPTLTLGLARAYAGQHKYVAAQEAYNRIIREHNTSVPAFAKAYEDATKEIESVAPKIAGVTVTVAGAGGEEIPNPTVTLDDKPLNVAALGVRRSIDPGDHVVKVSADGYKPAEVRFTVAEGGTASAPVTLEKDANAGAAVASNPSGGPSSASNGTTASGDTSPGADSGVKVTRKSINKPLAYAAFGVGAAGLVTGAVTGLMALSKHSDLEEKCPGGVCGAGQKGDVDTYNTLGTVSTVGFIAGGVGLAAGAVLLLTAPKNPTPAKAAVLPYVGPGSIGAYGQF